MQRCSKTKSKLIKRLIRLNNQLLPNLIRLLPHLLIKRLLLSQLWSKKEINLRLQNKRRKRRKWISNYCKNQIQRKMNKPFQMIYLNKNWVLLLLINLLRLWLLLRSLLRLPRRNCQKQMKRNHNPQKNKSPRRPRQPRKPRHQYLQPNQLQLKLQLNQNQLLNYQLLPQR